MKKLSFVLALVFAGSFVMAQHVSNLTQSGGTNLATINQSFGGSGTALPGNISNVTQTGDLNIAEVDQINNGFAGSEHRSDILSNGNGNFAKVFQDLEDKGNAYIEQQGNDNNANIHEVGNFGAAEPINPPYDAYAKQTGIGNDVIIDIYGTNSTAWAFQYGNDNSITQKLGSAVGEKVQNSRALAQQYGNNNTINQTFEGEGFSGGISVVWDEERAYQDGIGNQSTQLIKDDILPSTNNFEVVNQTGDGNKSWQTQAGQNNWMSHKQTGDLNEATATQTGSFNHLEVTQMGNGNIAVDMQSGYQNKAYVQQN